MHPKTVGEAANIGKAIGWQNIQMFLGTPLAPLGLLGMEEMSKPRPEAKTMPEALEQFSHPIVDAIKDLQKMLEGH
jgi:hypothetical protein